LSTLILIRHCASLGQEPAAELSLSGVEAAAELAETLLSVSPDAVYSSPYRRAVATVAPFAERAGLPILLDDRLKERVLAERDLDDWLDHVRRSFDDWKHAAPGGESLAVVRDRALAALTEIAAAGHRLPIVASHGNLISAVLRASDPSFGFDQWRSLRNPELFELSFRQASLTSWRRLD
jgi:2,3-bisphosphoglycerate-dependent phosphoglycerate mutase